MDRVLSDEEAEREFDKVTDGAPPPPLTSRPRWRKLRRPAPRPQSPRRRERMTTREREGERKRMIKPWSMSPRTRTTVAVWLETQPAATKLLLRPLFLGLLPQSLPFDSKFLKNQILANRKLLKIAKMAVCDMFCMCWKTSKRIPSAITPIPR